MALVVGALAFGQSPVLRAAAGVRPQLPASLLLRTSPVSLLLRTSADGVWSLDYRHLPKYQVADLRDIKPARFTTHNLWLSSLANFRHSQVLRGVLQPLLAVTCFSALCWALRAFAGNHLPGSTLARMHQLSGGALSLLLVFRTNAAYNRFWEARCVPSSSSPALAPMAFLPQRPDSAHAWRPPRRCIWERLLNRCRDLARFADLYRDEMGAKRVDLIGAPPNGILNLLDHECRAPQVHS